MLRERFKGEEDRTPLFLVDRALQTGLYGPYAIALMAPEVLREGMVQRLMFDEELPFEQPRRDRVSEIGELSLFAHAVMQIMLRDPAQSNPEQKKGYYDTVRVEVERLANEIFQREPPTLDFKAHRMRSRLLARLESNKLSYEPKEVTELVQTIAARYGLNLQEQ